LLVRRFFMVGWSSPFGVQKAPLELFVHLRGTPLTSSGSPGAYASGVRHSKSVTGAFRSCFARTAPHPEGHQFKSGPRNQVSKRRVLWGAAFFIMKRLNALLNLGPLAGLSAFAAWKASTALFVCSANRFSSCATRF